MVKMDFVIIFWNKWEKNKPITIKEIIPIETRWKLIQKLRELKGQKGDVYMLKKEGSIYQQRILYNLDIFTEKGINLSKIPKIIKENN